MYTNIPSFAIGRLAWDNWLLWRATSQGTPIVDATAAVTVVHQEHGYAAGTVKKFDKRWVELGPEAQQNLALAPYEKSYLTIWAAMWTIDQQGVLRRRSLNLRPAHLKQQLLLASIRWPALGRLYRLLLSVKRAMRRDERRLWSHRGSG